MHAIRKGSTGVDDRRTTALERGAPFIGHYRYATGGGG